MYKRQAIASLKKAGNYMKLAMRKNGPRSFKRGQGALIKVIYKAGEGTLSKDDAKKALGWRGRDVRFVAKKAADNGYLTIDKPKNGFQMTLTDLGREVIKKRLEAEDKAADEILAGLSDEEKAQLTSLCEKICQTAEDMGVDYSTIQKKRGKKLCKRHHGKGQGCGRHHGHGHGLSLIHIWLRDMPAHTRELGCPRGLPHGQERGIGFGPGVFPRCR